MLLYCSISVFPECCIREGNCLLTIKCLQSLRAFRDQPILAYNLILHEIMHAIGFSSSLFDW